MQELAPVRCGIFCETTPDKMVLGGPLYRHTLGPDKHTAPLNFAAGFWVFLTLATDRALVAAVGVALELRENHHSPLALKLHTRGNSLKSWAEWVVGPFNNMRVSGSQRI